MNGGSARATLVVWKLRIGSQRTPGLVYHFHMRSSRASGDGLAAPARPFHLFEPGQREACELHHLRSRGAVATSWRPDRPRRTRTSVARLLPRRHPNQQKSHGTIAAASRLPL
jgi:hypothetical protein